MAKVAVRRTLPVTRAYAQVLVEDFGAHETWSLVDIASGSSIPATVSSARNGVLSGWDLQNAVGPVAGTSAPYSDGASDYGNILTSSLIDIFDGDDYGVFVWFAPEHVESPRLILRLAAGADSYTDLLQHSDETFEWRRTANSDSYSATADIPSFSAWHSLAITCDKDAGDMGAGLWVPYLDGVPIDIGRTNLVSWSGALSAALIGAQTTTPTYVAKGWIAFVAVRFGSTWTATQIKGMHDEATQSQYCQWTRQGESLTDPASTRINETSVLYETAPQVLTGETYVFKCWYTIGGDIRYAESVDGLTWTVYGVVVSGAVTRPYMRRVDGAYYLYVLDISETDFHLYTSNDGVSFSLEESSVVSCGVSGDWDDSQLGNICVWNESAVWYMLYEARKSSTNWAVGLATASDPAGPWTKNASSPVLSNGAGAMGGPELHKVGGHYYVWGQYSVYGNIPTEIGLWRSSDLLTWEVVDMPNLARDTVDEGIGRTDSQVADPTIVEANGVTYMFYSALQDQLHSIQKLATAPTTLAVLLGEV